MYYGTESAVMVRDAKAWLFKEVGSEQLGWEVYARKDDFYTETGIALVANATKQAAIGTAATAGNTTPFTPLYYALEAFTANVGKLDETVNNIIAMFGDDSQSDGGRPEGFQARCSRRQLAGRPGRNPFGHQSQ